MWIMEYKKIFGTTDLVKSSALLKRDMEKML